MDWIKLGLINVCMCVGLCAAAAEDDMLVASSLLEQAGLQSAWQIQLPLKPAEQVERVIVFDDYLYVLTDRNFFFCIDRGEGSVQTLLQVAIGGLPVQPPIHFEKKSVFLVGHEMKVFDPVIGRITQTMKLSQLDGSSGGIARNSDYVYVCGSDKRLYAFSADEGVRQFMTTADNDSAIHSVLATDMMVWFGTVAGNIVAIQPSGPQKLWQFNLSGKMKIPLVLDGDFLYAGGLDSKLYKIDSARGTLAWEIPFLAGDAIRDPLMLGDECIYVYTAVPGLYAVDKRTGKAIWNLPQGRAVLSEKDTQSYAYTPPGILTVMDNVTGKEKVSVNIAAVDRYAVNMTDSTLYLANKKGRVMAANPVLEDKSRTAKP